MSAFYDYEKAKAMGETGRERGRFRDDSPVNFFPLTRGSPLGDLVFLKTAGAWQTAAVIFLAL